MNSVILNNNRPNYQVMTTNYPSAKHKSNIYVFLKEMTNYMPFLESISRWQNFIGWLHNCKFQKLDESYVKPCSVANKCMLTCLGSTESNLNNITITNLKEFTAPNQ